jgi:hypothetical protein
VLKKRKLIIIGSIVACTATSIILYQAYQEFIIYQDIPLTQQEIQLYKNTEKAVVIYPLFTQIAYSPAGFYNYYKKTCDTKCLTVKFNPFKIDPSYSMGKNAYERLLQLNYPVITDMYVDEHPEVLNQYTKVILLHQEYATQKLFDTISSHKNVIYLYPNDFYGVISTDYSNNTISLVQGHGYQINGSGFSWKYDNTHPAEFDIRCENWKFQTIPNGIELNCYPEFLINHNREILKEIKEYGN